MPTPAVIDPAATPMGANLVAGGATFRVWAPNAVAVHLVSERSGWKAKAANLLHRDDRGYWSGFWPDFEDGDEYKFHVKGTGSEGDNRDPYARELTDVPAFPKCNCVLRDPRRYSWHEVGFRPPPFHQIILYQLHVGSFWSPQGGTQPGTFLDVVSKLPYLVELGVNVLQLLPIVEFNTQFSMGYNGTDYFSPENAYGLPRVQVVERLPEINQLLSSRGLAPLTADDLDGPSNQLRCLVDLAHVHGLAVVFDVVYNHAGGDWGDKDGLGSLFFFDRQSMGNLNDSLYFTDHGHAGGLCFALWKEEVRQFLIDNAKFLFEEYRIDGLRHDQVSVIDEENVGSGWLFCQDITDTCHALRPDALQHAEYWPVNPWIVKPTAIGGAGFDTCYHDGLRDSVRELLAEAGGGEFAELSFENVRSTLWPPGLDRTWNGVQNLETHDEVYRERKPRIATLAGGGDARSWYARSRARVATGLLLTAPGTPMLFMGQEFIEAKNWADDVQNHADLRLDWDGATGGDPSMVDFLRFTREMIKVRRSLPALSAEGFDPYYIHDENRVIAFHRWMPGVGNDVVVVASLSEVTWYNYELGFPRAGAWREVFNSDVFDHFPNPQVAGNNGGIRVAGSSRDGLPYSAAIVIPANSLLVFSWD